MSYLANDGLMQQDCSGNGEEIECDRVGCVHYVLGNQVQREPEPRKLLFQCVWPYGAVIFHYQLFGRAGFMRRKDLKKKKNQRKIDGFKGLIALGLVALQLICIYAFSVENCAHPGHCLYGINFQIF